MTALLGTLLASPLLLLLLKLTVVVSIGLVAVTLLKRSKRSKASTRHLILLTTFAALIVIPATELFSVNGLRIVAVGATGTVTETSAASTAPSEIELASSGERASASSVSVASASASTSGARVQATAAEASSTDSESPSLARLLVGLVFGLWLTVGAFFLFGLAVDLRKLATLRRSAIPARKLQPLVDELADGTSTEVSTHEDVDGPLVCGVFRPAILLPPAALDWSSVALRRALIHEVEHLRRYDWLSQVLVRVLVSIYWFHPLVWIASRKVSLEAECAADDAVVRDSRIGVDEAATDCATDDATDDATNDATNDATDDATDYATDYADQLVALARLRSAPTLAAIGMANRSDLAVRVQALLASDLSRGQPSARVIGFAVGVAVIILAVLAPLRVEAASFDLLKPPAEISLPLEARHGSESLGFALISASAKGDLEAVSELLDRGADLNAAIPLEGSPLIVAAREGHAAVALELLARGADANLAVRFDGNPLIMASKFGHLEIVRTLLEYGARIDDVVPDDENPLIGASAKGHFEVVEFLVARGANVNAKALAGSEWRTPLSMARRGNHSQVVSLLLSSGARE